MSMIFPGAPLYAPGAFVRTPKKQVGQVVRAYLEREPQHDWDEWDEELNCWLAVPDEYMQHVYHIEIGEEIEPWPQDMLESVSILDALI